MGEGKTVGRESIAIGSDHAGFPLKEDLREALEMDGYAVHDFGAFSSDSVDYPDIARDLAVAVASGRFRLGILICGTGVGMSISANKVRGIRAAACSDPYSAAMARRHNDANILTMGGRVVGIGLAVETAKAFLRAEFEGGRHKRRVAKINALDERLEH